MASTLSDDTAPSAALDRLKARAAPTRPGAQPEPLGSLPWPQELASGRPKVEDFPLSTTRQRRLGKEETQHRKKQRLLEQRQLREWDDELAGGAGNKTVVLVGLFSEEEAASEGADFYANLKSDVEAECRKAGALDKVHIFEGSEKGAAAVKFKSPEDAQRCVAMMNERRFGGTQISCVFYDGVTDYRPKRLQEAAAHPATDSVEEQEKNLSEYADWLEADSTDEEIAADDE